MFPVYIAALLVTAIAAFTDTRSGRIPNWLTVPLLVVAPLYHGVMQGWMAGALSALAVILCGFLPFFLFSRNAMGGGDVKLLAGLGALFHPYFGVEVQFLSYVLVSLLLLGRMAWEGRLFATLMNSVWAFWNLVLPARMHRPLEQSSLTQMRMGIPIFLATALSIALRVVGGVS